MTAPATIAIVIATPRGLRHFASPCARDAALPAEALLRTLGAEVHRASFWVQCADTGTRNRLADYLRDVQAEVLADAALDAG